MTSFSELIKDVRDNWQSLTAGAKFSKLHAFAQDHGVPLYALLVLIESEFNREAAASNYSDEGWIPAPKPVKRPTYSPPQIEMTQAFKETPPPKTKEKTLTRTKSQTTSTPQPQQKPRTVPPPKLEQKPEPQPKSPPPKTKPTPPPQKKPEVPSKPEPKPKSKTEPVSTSIPKQQSKTPPKPKPTPPPKAKPVVEKPSTSEKTPDVTKPKPKKVKPEPNPTPQPPPVKKVDYGTSLFNYLNQVDDNHEKLNIEVQNTIVAVGTELFARSRNGDSPVVSENAIFIKASPSRKTWFRKNPPTLKVYFPKKSDETKTTDQLDQELRNTFRRCLGTNRFDKYFNDLMKK